jgi:hypothetical protein
VVDLPEEPVSEIDYALAAISGMNCCARCDLTNCFLTPPIAHS